MKTAEEWAREIAVEIDQRQLTSHQSQEIIAEGVRAARKEALEEMYQAIIALPVISRADIGAAVRQLKDAP